MPPQDSAVYAKIQKRIRLIRQEINDQENRSVGDVSDNELDSLIDQLPDQDDAVMILNKVLAFKEIGLHSKAVPEFAGLFHEHYPAEKIVPELTDSLLKLHAPAKAASRLEELLANWHIAARTSARIHFLFGREMEKRDQREPTLDRYKAALKMDPENFCSTSTGYR